ncbi:MAG: hypothetical protein JJE35_03025 [Thermoleophilia bacterium]|nr:hypothetical protein [Thermoleophilia bacterium]
MTTVTSDQERTQRLEQLDAMAAREWAAYGARLRDLEGAEYDATEIEAWDELQNALEHLRGERQTLLPLDESAPDLPS